MAAEPQEPPQAAPAGEDRGERYGPLLVRRIVKGDGRALIRFDRVDERERA